MTTVNVQVTQQAAPSTRPIRVAVPRLESYHAHTGIGRVLHSLRAQWDNRVNLVPASFDALPLPIIRNFPLSVRPSAPADLILLPQITGVQALRNTQGIPSVVIVHDVGIVDFAGDRHAMDWLTYQSVLRSFHGLRYASQIVAVSQFTRDRLVHHLPELAERVVVIPDGVSSAFLDYDQSQSTARQTIESYLGRALGQPSLLYIGSEVPRKNVSLLLRVVQLLKADYPRSQLLKVGQAGDARWRAETLRAATDCNLRVGRDVQLLEDIPDPMLAHAYCAADVFVSASLYEGFGLPALEALAVGTPVVVSNQGAFPEVVGDAGWVSDPEPNQFAMAVSEAIAKPAMEERLRKMRVRAAGNTWERAAEAYLDTFRRLMKRHR